MKYQLTVQRFIFNQLLLGNTESLALNFFFISQGSIRKRRTKYIGMFKAKVLVIGPCEVIK